MTAPAQPVDLSASPAATPAVRRGYLDQALVGYLIYGVGAVTAFLAVRLALSDAEAGLHSTAIAVGMVSAGLTSHRLDSLFSMRVVHFTGLGSLGAAVGLIVWAPALWATMLGAFAAGLGAGLLLSHVNQVMSAGGGALARVRLARSTLVAMLTSVTVPVFIGIGAATGIGWQLALLPAAVLVGIGVIATTGFEERPVQSVVDRSRLPQRFWFAWVLVVLVIAAEFSSVFWASTLVREQTGVTLADATLVISAFIGGMIAGRVGLSLHAVSAHDPVRLMRAGLGIGLLSLLLTWVSTSYEVSMIAMFFAGIGIGVLFPLGAAVTLDTVPGRAHAASGRLVLASGAAILVAPLVLGVMADLAGVAVAWLILPVVCIAALLLTLPVGRARRSRSA